ncbi:P-loop NTPase [Fretibacter rubidus]|uniref:Mrp/NBP35 family ATP-binding protein n=1 Tax=Fretibacter rubidus TaxID=570162 RepID=UPI00352A0DB4
MSYSEAAALSALKDISDPISGRDIVSAGLLGDLSFKAGVLRAILLIDPARAKDYGPVREAMEAALKTLPGIDRASVLMTAHKSAPAVTKPRPNASGEAPKRSGNPHQARRPEGYQGDAHVKKTIAISSAKGGVGKSTVSVNLAVALARMGKSVGLLDADIHGPSAPIVLGLKGARATTVRVQDRPLIKPLEAYGIKAMSIGFLTKDDGPIIWRGPMVQGAMSKMLWDCDWGELDVLLIDMPPGTGDAQLGLAQDIKPDGAVIVSTPQDLALADARKGVMMFEKVDIPIVGVVENMSIFTCPDCGATHNIFGGGGAEAEAKTMKVPFLGAAPLAMSIRESGDSGVPVAATDDAAADYFKVMAEKLLANLA